MIDENTYEKQTRNLIIEAKTELEQIEKQIKELSDRSIVLIKEINAFETTLTGYLRRTGKESKIDDDLVKAFKGMTHKEKLLELAKHWGGKITVTGATDFLYPHGLIQSKNRGNAYIVVGNVLAEMAEGEKKTLEKVAPAEFRLIEDHQTILTPE
ncbi:MAG: hypothetical protein JW901_06575 [Dehalococcoidia bacterium]|nr:hypothetical protein [Dehalococcoidia bacterium]